MKKPSKHHIILLYSYISAAAFCVALAPAQALAADNAALSARTDPVATLTAEQWELAREGEKIVALAVLNDLVRRWSGSERKIIEIQYPGGEEGEIWVNELKGWLVSLGIASRYLMTVPGSGQADLVRFKIINGGDNFQ